MFYKKKIYRLYLFYYISNIMCQVADTDVGAGTIELAIKSNMLSKNSIKNRARVRRCTNNIY